MWVAVTSACSEKAPCLPAAPATFPAAEHFPCARVKAWPAWSPAGILCWTSALPHLPDNEVLVCAEAIATARATIAQTHRFLSLIRNLLADCKLFLLHFQGRPELYTRAAHIRYGWLRKYSRYAGCGFLNRVRSSSGTNVVRVRTIRHPRPPG